MLTVIFATRNGAQTLPRVLEAYCHLQNPDGGWRLVVVDNGSTDETLRVLEDFRSSLPLTITTEHKPGKNAALNAGIELVLGDLVVLTDDDAIPKPDWLVRMRQVSAANLEFGVFGGAVLPRWEAEPPRWIRSSI